ncbi:NAD(P)/FAD-dependent oxidoreductase [Amycolatopsis circi]|uniref:NAD(P)/FAD-dependent oxidoreductase n=1 Tax=Amycolatopsis circi TaxID=871959 RepID=UPI000E26C0F2|nr:FAD-dependent oxidoreductase [Amycolatopsis circi]
MRRRLVIVGACLAGLRAAEAARRTGFAGEITLVGAEPHLPYDRPPLSKAYLDEPEAPALPAYRDESVLRQELDLDLRLGVAATALDLEQRVVGLDDGEVSYTELVLATGARARTLPGMPAIAGVHTLRTVDDAAAVRAALDGGARTVVVGAGFIGSEVASGARKRGLPVTVVELAHTPLTRSVGLEVGAVFADLHRQNGTDLRLGVGVESVLGDDKASGVRLSDGTELAADLVVVGAGAAPATDWLRDSGLQLDERDGGLVCDETLNAGYPGVYGAGDVAHWHNPLFDRRMRLEHWTSAAEQGAAAARNALDPAAAKPYGTVPYFWSDWYGHRIQFVGVPGADEARVLPGEKFLALYREGDRLAGALTVDQPTLIMKFRRLVARRATWREALEFAGAKTASA